MSIEIARRVKVLEGLVQELKNRSESRSDTGLESRVKELEAKYKMLNARLSKKNNNGDDGIGASGST